MMRFTVRPCTLAVATACVLLGACAGNPAAPASDHSQIGGLAADAQGRLPRPLAPHVLADRREGERNLVLNAMLAAKVAWDIGAIVQARALLDIAYQRIETLYADNPAAAKARSTFAPESTKEFKGEPYERAMVGYYLGLADLLSGELDNARSAFRWGEFQDTMSAAEKYQGDTAALLYLAGWVDHCRGRASSARENFALATSFRPGVSAPAAADNALVILEAGAGPKKARSGKHGEELVYEPAPRPAAQTAIEVAGRGAPLAAFLAEDLQWQATTLGGRAVDKILAGKAVFKDNATAVANAGATVTGVATEVMRVGANSGDRQTLNLGAYGAAAGLLMSVIGSATAAAARPEADVRAWSNLPGAIYLASLRVEPERASQMELRASLPATPGGGEQQGRWQRIPGTGCFVARLASTTLANWNGSTDAAWVSLQEIESVPVPVPRAAAGGNPAPVRATF